MSVKDILGRRAKLLHKIERRDGVVLRKGRVFKVYSTWRGRYTLVYVEKPRPGMGPRVAISHLDRGSFEVLP